MSRELYIDQEECIGCGLCAEIASNVFRVNDKGVAEIMDPQGDEETVIQDARNECPAECIHWQEK